MCTIARLASTIRRFAIACAVASAASLSFAQELIEEPAGYRTENYRAPVPATLAGARVVTTKEAEALWRSGTAIFIDVLPRPPKPDLPEGTVWRDLPHADIPGSVWLADVGYGGLTETMERWYRDSLALLTAGDAARPLVIYCKAECWMSWNAARRAVEWGYSAVIWYPGGVDEWEAAGLPLEERTPEPRPEEPKS
ncbi:MAG: PQQ-dependent catabolism-associated CXXCW motif protein [Propylenella sp.]